MRNQYPTSNQERELLALEGIGLIQHPKATDISTHRTVCACEMQTSARSTIHTSPVEATLVSAWLNSNGFHAVQRHGKVVY
jgi:hypothetical protein